MSFPDVFFKTIKYIHINSQKIFAFVGVITFLAVILYFAWMFVGFVSNQNGFSFDPVLWIILSIFGVQTILLQKERNQILNQQVEEIKKLTSLKPSLNQKRLKK